MQGVHQLLSRHLLACALRPHETLVEERFQSLALPSISAWRSLDSTAATSALDSSRVGDPGRLPRHRSPLAARLGGPGVQVFRDVRLPVPALGAHEPEGDDGGVAVLVDAHSSAV